MSNICVMITMLSVVKDVNVPTRVMLVCAVVIKVMSATCVLILDADHLSV